MIVYDLQCGNHHVFEGWFEDEDAYKSQQERNIISCPVCNNNAVFRIPSTFAIKSSASSVREPNSALEEKLYQQMAAYIDTNFDDVGAEFAREALKIHYGVTEPRNIKGKSTDAEEQMLKDEGVEFLKIPMPPRSDTNN